MFIVLIGAALTMAGLSGKIGMDIGETTKANREAKELEIVSNEKVQKQYQERATRMLIDLNPVTALNVNYFKQTEQTFSFIPVDIRPQNNLSISIEQYQKSKNLKNQTGVADLETLQSLSRDLREKKSKEIVALKLGSKGKEVRELQEQLQRLGFYKGKLDGDFGPQTQKALIAFKSKERLSNTDEADTETFQRLNRLINEKESQGNRTVQNSSQDETYLAFGSTGKAVEKLQKKLKEKNYYNGEIDGIYGAKTKEAVLKFQSEKKIAMDGIAGEQTLGLFA